MMLDVVRHWKDLGFHSYIAVPGHNTVWQSSGNHVFEAGRLFILNSCLYVGLDLCTVGA